MEVSEYSRESIRLTWQPSELEKVPISSYHVEKREAPKGSAQRYLLGIVASSETSFLIIRNLAADVDYYFRVIAENAVGLSQPLVLERS